MKMQNAKKYIIIAAAVILVMIAVITAIKLPIYLRLKTPFRHIINGFTAADSREMLEALPDALVEKWSFPTMITTIWTILFQALPRTAWASF